MANSTSGPQADGRDLVNYLKKNGCKRRKDIVQYMTQDVKKEGLTPVGSSTVDKWLRYLVGVTKEVTHSNRDYCPAEPEGKGIGPEVEFSKKVKKETNMEKSLQGTAFLLEAAALLLDKIRPRGHSHETVISEKKEECRAHLASINKIIAEKFAHLAVRRENEYDTMVKKARKSHNEKRFRSMAADSYALADFRDAFSDVILRMREKCERMRRVPPTTYEEGAVNDSCKLVSVALNTACRDDYDLVVHSYEYDEGLDMFKIDMSELRGTPYEISRLYLDGKDHMFSLAVHEQEPGLPPRPDCTVEFYPEAEIDEYARHTLSVMVRCVEFSFEIAGIQRRHGRLFLDHIKNDVAGIDPVYPQHESDTILLTPQVGGKIQDVIESFRGRDFECRWCDKIHPCNRWIGCPDGSGDKYLMAIRCRGTGREVPLRHIRENIFE